VILVCCVIALAIGIIWIFFCYCICKTDRDYQTARMVGVVSFHAVVTFLVLDVGSPGNRNHACSKTCASLACIVGFLSKILSFSFRRITWEDFTCVMVVTGSFGSSVCLPGW